MSGFRFSLGHFLGAVGALCLGCGAICNWSPLIASVSISSFLLLNCLALSGACAATGGGKSFWIGTAVFGIGYWYVAGDNFTHLPESPVTAVSSWTARPLAQRTELLTDRLLNGLEAILARPSYQVGEMVMARWNSGNLYAGKILAVNGSSYQIGWTDGSSPSWVPVTDIYPGGASYRATGHAVFGILLALLGGSLTAMMFGVKSEEPALEPAAESKAVSASMIAGSSGRWEALEPAAESKAVSAAATAATSDGEAPAPESKRQFS